MINKSERNSVQHCQLLTVGNAIFSFIWLKINQNCELTQGRNKGKIKSYFISLGYSFTTCVFLLTESGISGLKERFNFFDKALLCDLNRGGGESVQSPDCS